MPHETRYERVQQFIRDQRRIICLENEQRWALEMEKQISLKDIRTTVAAK